MAHISVDLPSISQAQKKKLIESISRAGKRSKEKVIF